MSLINYISTIPYNNARLVPTDTERRKREREIFEEDIRRRFKAAHLDFKVEFIGELAQEAIDAIDPKSKNEKIEFMLKLVKSYQKDVKAWCVLR